MSTETWHKGYKEVRNIIHNEVGLSKEDILEVFKQIAKDDIQKIVKENSSFIHETIKEVIKTEMMHAVEEHNYPKISQSFWNYTEKDSFRDFIIGVMKDEVLDNLRQQFEFKLDIEKKS